MNSQLQDLQRPEGGGLLQVLGLLFLGSPGPGGCKIPIPVDRLWAKRFSTEAV